MSRDDRFSGPGWPGDPAGRNETYVSPYPGVGARPPGRALRLLRGVSGALTAGLCVLALVVVGAQVVGGRWDFPGPGAESVTVHVLGAVGALVVQWFVDRRSGPIAALGATVVTVIVAAVLWTQWWG